MDRSKAEDVQGLNYDLVVHQVLTRERGQKTEDATTIEELRKETGLTEAQIVRAIHQIRQKGYLIVSHKTARAAENKFRIPSSEPEYRQWRDRLIDDISSLISLLHLCDAGAKKQYGAMVSQERFDF